MSMESVWAEAERAASALAPETDLFADRDVAGFNRALTLAARGVAANPTAATSAAITYAARLAQVPVAAVSRWLGAGDLAPVELDPRDRRFADPTWRDNPAFYALRLVYEVTCRLLDDLVEAAELDTFTAAKARLALQLIIDATAPTNLLATNPAALKRALETGGLSVLRGAANFVDDVLHNGGRPRQVDTRPFTLGVNLAATPGRVIYRNDLMELIQYEPRTPQVRSAPLLCSPPWICLLYTSPSPRDS